MKPNCMECHYGGMIVCLADKTASCKNENNPNRFINPKSTWSGDKHIVHTKSGDGDIECIHFVPELSSIDDKIILEPITEFNLTYVCPHCQEMNTECGRSSEGKELVTCYECGKLVGLSWTIY